jgi:guanylate kinase
MTFSGIPLVISAPSGGGKSTIASRIVKELPHTAQSISCTTRSPRPGEKNGIDYFFVSESEFKTKIDKGEFLEWAVVHDHYYGTPISDLQKKLADGKDVILTIDPQGAMSIKRVYPQGIYVFVVPPSWEDLLKRLKNRATDNSTSLEIRIANARKELSYISHYDYLIINDDLEKAIKELSSIITAEHCRIHHVNQKNIPILSQAF